MGKCAAEGSPEANRLRESDARHMHSESLLSQISLVSANLGRQLWPGRAECQRPLPEPARKAGAPAIPPANGLLGLHFASRASQYVPISGRTACRSMFRVGADPCDSWASGVSISFVGGQRGSKLHDQVLAFCQHLPFGRNEDVARPRPGGAASRHAAGKGMHVASCTEVRVIAT